MSASFIQRRENRLKIRAQIAEKKVEIYELNAKLEEYDNYELKEFLEELIEEIGEEGTLNEKTIENIE